VFKVHRTSPVITFVTLHGRQVVCYFFKVILLDCIPAKLQLLCWKNKPYTFDQHRRLLTPAVKRMAQGEIATVIIRLIPLKSYRWRCKKNFLARRSSQHAVFWKFLSSKTVSARCTLLRREVSIMYSGSRLQRTWSARAPVCAPSFETSRKRRVKRTNNAHSFEVCGPNDAIFTAGCLSASDTYEESHYWVGQVPACAAAYFAPTTWRRRYVAYM
jgi:hypothetical protein